MRECGKDPESLGCEICKPTLASIFASLFNQHVIDKPRHMLQDTNDKFLANIQRNGTFSVIPRVPGGEITAERLIVIGTVAKKYNLYCKITGGQRIDMFGARKQDLVGIWTDLVEAGMESGHAYAKSLRTVKVGFFCLISAQILLLTTPVVCGRVVSAQLGAGSASAIASEWPSGWSSDTRAFGPRTRSKAGCLGASGSARKPKTKSSFRPLTKSHRSR